MGDIGVRTNPAQPAVDAGGFLGGRECVDHPSGPRQCVAVHHRAVPRSPPALRAGLAVLVPCALVTGVALIWLCPHGVGGGQPGSNGQRQLHGEVSSVEHLPCPPPPAEGTQPPPGAAAACGAVLVRLTDGPDAGKLVATDIPFGPGAPTVRRGDRVVLLYIPDAAADQRYQILDQQRGFQLWKCTGQTDGTPRATSSMA